jgi:levanbiose-producing levanase
VIDLQDGTFVEGRFGLHVFGGYVIYQNANVNGEAPASLRTSSLVNAGIQKYLYTEKLADGEAIILKDANDSTDQKWVFVPTVDDKGFYSIRTTDGQTFDLHTGQKYLSRI